MADQTSLISDPFASAEGGPQPFEIGQPSPPPRPRSLISDPQETDRLVDAARRAPATTPDQAARVLRLQRRTGLPLEVIERNTDDVERQSAAQDFDPERFRAESPLLARWLAEHSQNMALAQDDLRPLSTMESLLGVGRNIAGAVGASAARFKGSIWGAIRGGAEFAEEVTGATVPPLAERATYGMLRPGTVNLRKQPTVQNPDGSISTVDSLSVNIEGEEILLPTVTPDGRHFRGTPDQVTEQAIAEYEKTGLHLGVFASPEGATKYAQQLHDEYAAGKYGTPTQATQYAEYARTAAVAAKQLADQRRGPQTGSSWFARQVYGGIESFGQQLPGMAAGLAFGPEASLAMAGLTTGGESYQEGREQGLGVGRALEFGGLQGTIEIATEFTPAHVFFGDLAAKAPLLKVLAHEIATEIPGEEIATALQDLNEWAYLPENKDRTIGDYWRERPSAALATAISTLVAVGAQGVTGHATARVVERLGKAAGESKTRERAPEELRAFIDQVTRDGPLATIGLPIDTFTSYFQSKQMDPAQMATQLTGDATAYARARETGTDLAVPMGRYLSELGGTEHNTFFAQEARLAPLALNAREEVALDHAVASEISGAPAEPTTAGQVRDAALEMLQQAGLPPTTARVYAELTDAAFSTIGARAGLNPLELYRRYGLEVTREGFARESSPTAAATAEAGPSARFFGYQPTAEGQTEPLFTIVGGPRDRSTVTAPTLQQLGIAPPADIPTPEAYFRERARVAEKRTLAQDEQIRQTQREAEVDVKTGVANSNAFERAKPAADANPNVAYATFDLNNFKAVNDALGHTVGDEALKRAATAIQQAASEFGFGERVFRPGGDEFAVLASPDVIDQIRDRAEELVGTQDMGGVSFSVSGTTGPTYKAADDQLQARKGARKQSVQRDQEQVYRHEERGVIRFGKDRQFRIDLFESANLSTLLHESAHFYLEVVGDVVDELAGRDPTTLTDTQRRMLADYGAVLEWFGVGNRSDISTEHHERFARGFEAYLMEGAAPSPELRSVFARVRAWLTSIYRTVRRLDVQVTPEIRAVMDRLLATDDAIAAAQADQQQLPLFTDAIADAAGLSAADRDAYRATVQAASDHARETLQAELLQQLQRERAAWWKDERANVRAQVARDIGAQSIYRALALLQRGTLPDGSALPAGVLPFKLSRQLLIEQFGDGVLKRLPRPAVYTARDGVPPAVAAELLGFRNAQELIRLLVSTPPLEVAIDAAADEEMRRRHGDMLTDGSLGEHARQAVLEAGGDVFAAELKALSAAVTRQPGGRKAAPVPPLSTVRAIAERRIGDTAIRDLRPGAFAAAARRAGNQALEAAGRQDFSAALQHKQRQLLNAELYRAATAARQMVEDAKADFHPIVFGRDATLAGRYNIDLVNAARALLAQFHLAPPAQAAAAAVYLEQVRKYDPEMLADLDAATTAAAQPAQNYREMSVDAFTALRDAVASLWHTARRSRQIVIEGKARDLEDVRGELEGRLQAISTPKERRGYARALTQWEKTKLSLMGMRAALRRVESWVDAVDGRDPQGAFRRLVFNGISEAGSAYRIAKKGYVERYLGIVKAVESSLTTNEIAAPELASFAAPEGYTFNGTIELLHALLHTGNESNLSKLLRGRNWGEEGMDGSVDTSRWDAFLRRLAREGTLTKAHYDYVQGVWDLLEDLKPQAQSVHHELTGYYFAEVTARPVQTPFGEYRGGYMPAIVDPEIADDAAIRADRAAVEETSTSFMFPSTGRGFTKGRIEPYARPLKLDLRVVPAHLDRVLRFVHLEPRVKDVARLVTHRGFRRALNAFDPTVAGEMLVPWLQRAAKQTIDTPSQGWGGRGADRFWRAIRRRTGAQIMFGNVLNALQQVTGLSVSAVKVPKIALTRALFRYMRQPAQLAADVAEKSAFMQTRTATQTLEVQRQIDDLLLNPSKYEELRAFAAKHGYFLQEATQNVVDVVTWSAAYDHAVSQGATERDAVRQGDSAVRLTQGSFNPEDVSKFETSGPMLRAFSMFFGYWNMQANTLGTEFSVAARDLGLKAGAGRMFYVYAFGFMIPAILSELITAAGRGELPTDDDDDGILDDWLLWFFGVQGRAVASMVPGGQLATYAAGQWFGEHVYDDRISVSPAISAIERAVHAPVSVYNAIVNDGRKKTAIRDTLTAIGLLTGLPTAALARPLGYAADVAEERTAPEGPVDIARGLVTGR